MVPTNVSAVASTMKPQAKTRRDLYKFLILFCDKYQYTPTIQEMCYAIDIIQNKPLGKTSKSVPLHHLRILERNGHIERIRGGRFRILQGRWTYIGPDASLI